ncbi:MAG: hypothetical protein ACLVJ8_03735 [Ruthenibacterium lactatiformans]
MFFAGDPGGGAGGRAAQAGRALIQTVDPNHPVLNLAARQDYKSFLQRRYPSAG